MSDEEGQVGTGGWDSSLCCPHLSWSPRRTLGDLLLFCHLSPARVCHVCALKGAQGSTSPQAPTSHLQSSRVTHVPGLTGLRDQAAAAALGGISLPPQFLRPPPPPAEPSITLTAGLTPRGSRDGWGPHEEAFRGRFFSSGFHLSHALAVRRVRSEGGHTAPRACEHTCESRHTRALQLGGAGSGKGPHLRVWD